MQVTAAYNDENSSAAFGPAQVKQHANAPHQAIKQASVQKSARKAFGNITNSSQPRAGDASAAKPQAQLQRRVFGDITNSAAKPPPGAALTAASKKPQQATLSLFAPSSKKVLAEAAPPAQSSTLPGGAPTTHEASSSEAEWWHGLEPDRSLGKTWEQQEVEREAAIEAEACRAAEEVWQSVYGGSLFTPMLPQHVQDSDDEAADAFRSVEPLPNLQSSSVEAVPEVPLEQLLFPAGTDYSNLLPDIRAVELDIYAPMTLQQP